MLGNLRTNWILDIPLCSGEQEVLEQVLVQGKGSSCGTQRTATTQGYLQDMSSIREDFSAFNFVMFHVF